MNEQSNKTIQKLTNELVKEIVEITDIDNKIELLNYIRGQLHEVSPLKRQPVDYVEWVKKEHVFPNDYNPNYVSPPEMKLLRTSIEKDGFTMPIPNDNSILNHRIIVDGFHRYTLGKTAKEIYSTTYGYLPMSNIRKENRGKENRVASTIRHNRARGSHSIDLMQNIVTELVNSGMSDAWIMKNIGMDADELLRLKQLTGLQELFINKEFSMSDENN